MARSAETAITATDKRPDKLDTFVAPLDKSVKLRLETRGASKDLAVVKLQALVQEQAKEFDTMPQEQMKALQDAMEENAARFEKRVGLERAIAQAGFDKARGELKGSG